MLNLHHMMMTSQQLPFLVRCHGCRHQSRCSLRPRGLLRTLEFAFPALDLEDNSHPNTTDKITITEDSLQASLCGAFHKGATSFPAEYFPQKISRKEVNENMIDQSINQSHPINRDILDSLSKVNIATDVRNN
ncbi:hypothetical protein C0J52_27743 [Blattella germanica]|nr:hypothetical protein C0J52_27743 [Blattella germanica]